MVMAMVMVMIVVPGKLGRPKFSGLMKVARRLPDSGPFARRLRHLELARVVFSPSPKRGRSEKGDPKRKSPLS